MKNKEGSYQTNHSYPHTESHYQSERLRLRRKEWRIGWEDQ